MDPARFYEVNCDCVGILKERASDIENKKPHQTRRTNWRKKTTKVGTQKIVFENNLSFSCNPQNLVSNYIILE